jgi:phage protein D
MAGILSYPVRRPRWDLYYNGQHATGRVSPMTVSITWTDKIGQYSSDLEFELSDREKRWQRGWFPEAGDRLSLAIGYEGEQLHDCGDFQVDELDLKGPPDTMIMRCMATYITPRLRTRNSFPFESRTLLDIATFIASKHGFTVVGIPNELNVSFQRVTQYHETDLAFLRRLANEHNFEFNIQSNHGKPQLVFYPRPALEAAASVMTILRTQVERFDFKQKTQGTFANAQVSYQDPSSKGLIQNTTTANPKPVVTDSHTIITRCENGQQAALKSRAALHDMNKDTVTGQITLPGRPKLLAGVNVTISGFGVFDNGPWQVTEAKHTLTRGQGYTTEATIRMLGIGA